jgi:hypothetical protein
VLYNRCPRAGGPGPGPGGCYITCQSEPTFQMSPGPVTSLSSSPPPSSQTTAAHSIRPPSGSLTWLRLLIRVTSPFFRVSCGARPAASHPAWQRRGRGPAAAVFKYSGCALRPFGPGLAFQGLLRGPPSRAIGGWPLRVSLPAIYYWIVQNNTLSHVLIRVIYDPRVVLNPQSPFYREEMRALRIGIVLFGILGCVQSLDTIGFMVKRVVSPEQSLTPMKIGGSEFVSPERGRNLYRRSSIIQSGCPDSAQCNISFNFSEVKRVGLED